MSTDALLPLRDVTSHLRVLGEHYVGVREIPVDQIVGSVNRSVDFDRFFRTGKRHAISSSIEPPDHDLNAALIAG